MGNLEVGLIGIAAFCLLLALGMPIAFSGALVGFIGMWLVAGIRPATMLLGALPYSVTSNYVFCVLPLFILMGNLAFACGFTKDIFIAARQWVGRLPGGLAVGTILGGAGFAAVCGSSIAAAATLTKIALPEMQKHGYQAKLATGSIAVAGLLATIIPPSNLIVVYGIVTEQPIGKLLLAGYIPGLMMAVGFMLTIILRAWHNPSLGGAIYGITWKQRLDSIKKIVWVFLLVILVMGGIYAGIFTPVEAGAVGALGAILLGMALRRLKFKDIQEAILQTAETTAMVFIILVGMFLLAAFLAYVRFPVTLAEIVAGLSVPPMVILIGALIMYFVLGMFMESIGMLILTLPIIFPTFVNLGFDPIWFGIIIVLMCEIGMITPPVGVVVFAVRSSAPTVSIEDIYWGTAWMLPACILVVALVIIFPQLALIIPNLMRT